MTAAPPSPTRTSSGPRTRVADAAVVALLAAIVCVPVWPGIFTVDSQAIYRGAIEDRISTWYSPTLGWIWGIAAELGMPPGGALVAGVAGVVAALLATYRLWLSPAWSRVATSTTILWPPVYGMLAWVGRDVWFLGLILTVIALLGWAARLPQHRRTLVAVAVVPAWLAFDARQNGFPVLAVWGATAAWWATGHQRWKVVVIPVAAVLAVGLGAGVRLAANTAIGVERLYPEQVLYYQDLFAVSLAVDQPLLPPSLFPSQDLDEVRRRQQAGVGWDAPTPLVPMAADEEDDTVAAGIASAWLRMVRSRPLEYLQVRGRLYAEQLSISRPAQDVYFASSAELDWFDGTGTLRQAFPALNERRMDVLNVFTGEPPGVGGPLHTVWAYLLLGLAGATVIALVPGSSRVLGVSALVLQVTLQGGLALLAPAPQYRFQLFQVVLGILLAVAAATTLRQRLRRRRE